MRDAVARGTSAGSPGRYRRAPPCSSGTTVAAVAVGAALLAALPPAARHRARSTRRCGPRGRDSPRTTRTPSSSRGRSACTSPSSGRSRCSRLLEFWRPAALEPTRCSSRSASRSPPSSRRAPSAWATRSCSTSASRPCTSGIRCYPRRRFPPSCRRSPRSHRSSRASRCQRCSSTPATHPPHPWMCAAPRKSGAIRRGSAQFGGGVGAILPRAHPSHTPRFGHPLHAPRVVGADRGRLDLRTRQFLLANVPVVLGPPMLSRRTWRGGQCGRAPPRSIISGHIGWHLPFLGSPEA